MWVQTFEDESRVFACHMLFMVQKLKSENDRQVIDDVKDEDSRKVKLAQAGLLNKKPKFPFAAGSTDGSDIREVSQFTKITKVVR